MVQEQGQRFRPIRMLLIGSHEANRIAVKAALEAASGFELQLAELNQIEVRRPKAASACDVLMILLDGAPDLWPERLQGWKDDSGAGPLMIAVTEQRSPEAVRCALRSGVQDVLFLPLEDSELTKALVRVAETLRISGVGRASTYSFASVSGGVGVTQLVANLGIALRELTGKSVALVDLAMQSGALSVALDIEAEHTIAELVDPTSPIDSIRLEAVLGRHPSGVHVLSAPRQIADSELVTATTVGDTLNVMLELFDYILIDCGHHVCEASVAAWEHSKQVFNVIDQSVSAIRGARRFSQLYQRLDLRDTPLDFIVNRFLDDHPITLDKLHEILTRPAAHTISRDDRAFLEAQLSGRTLWAMGTGREVRGELLALTQRLAGIATAASTNGNGKHGFLSRIIHHTLSSRV